MIYTSRQLESLDCNISFDYFSSQNRMEYEKRVRAQAKAMAATTDLLS
jgi:hypothetical protein